MYVGVLGIKVDILGVVGGNSNCRYYIYFSFKLQQVDDWFKYVVQKKVRVNGYYLKCDFLGRDRYLGMSFMFWVRFIVYREGQNMLVYMILGFQFFVIEEELGFFWVVILCFINNCFIKFWGGYCNGYLSLGFGFFVLNVSV